MSYFPVTIWLFPDEQTSPAAGVLFFAIHLFRMTTFFLIAGLFAHMMLERRGTGGFIRDRLGRIAGPLAGLWWIVFPAFIAVIVWKAAMDNGGAIPTDGPPPPPLTLETFPLLHLWFLWVLLILYTGLLVLRAPFAALDRGGGLGRLLDRRRDLLGRIERLWPVFTVVALGAGAAALMLAGGPVPPLAPLTDPELTPAAAAVYALAVFASTLAATALSLRFLSGYSAVRRYLADASYWVYIVHLPLVMVGQVLVLDAPWPWFAKLGAVVGGALAISLFSYELLVRHTFMGRWLNGRRVPWRRAARTVPVPAE
jgi:hypothetical protein